MLYNMLHRSSIVKRENFDCDDFPEYIPPRRVNPSPWRRKMTVCVAGICDNGSTLVAACDTMLTFYAPYTSIDSAGYKLHVVGNDNWLAMHTGTMADAEAVMIEVWKRIGDKFSAQAIGETFLESHEAVRRSRAETRYLSVFGLTMDSLLKTGRKAFGKKGVAEIQRRIQQVKVDLTTVIVGFEPTGVANLLSVSGEGIEHLTHDGSVAIGAGYENASVVLRHLKYRREEPFERAAYIISAAKILAQSSPTVGTDTILLRRRRGEEWEPLAPGQFAILQELWEDRGKLKIPDGAEGIVRNLQWGRTPPPSTSVFQEEEI